MKKIIIVLILFVAAFSYFNIIALPSLDEVKGIFDNPTNSRLLDQVSGDLNQLTDKLDN